MNQTTNKLKHTQQLFISGGSSEIPAETFMGATAGVSLAEEVLPMSKSVEVLGDTLDCFAWGFVGAGAALSSAILGNKLLAADAFTAFAATLLLPGMPDALSGFGSIVNHGGSK
jgi:hypothetical protein